MSAEGLAGSAVQVLSEYFQGRERTDVGHIAMQDLFTLVAGKLGVGFPHTVFLGFQENPADPVAAAALRLSLEQAIEQDGDFARGLTKCLGGRVPRRPTLLLRRIRVPALAAVGVVVAALGAGFGLGHAGGSPTVTAGPPDTVTVTVTPSTTAATTTATSSSAVTSSTTDQPLASGANGDGGALTKGASVYLAALPTTNDQWVFDHGDHDVQLTQYQNSLWYSLNSCGYTSAKQQFRLKNFTKLQAKAVGTDGTSDPALAVKFEVFANDDEVNPVGSVVANPGQAPTLDVNLPAGTFAVTVRVSVATVDKAKCTRGAAVLGSPYVVAAGH